jgi:ribose-phosphate pyrophosphokinase
MDLHAAQIQGFFDIPVDHLHAAPVIVRYFESIREQLGEIVVVSPDVGNAKMGAKYAEWLGGDLAIVDKRRRSGTEVESVNMIGDVAGKTALMFDDMITTAGTMCEAAKLVMKHGAKDVYAACTHPVLVGLAMERIAESPISKVVITDTIPAGPRCSPIQPKIVELSVAEILGEAIHRIHHNQSVSSLFRKGGGREVKA